MAAASASKTMYDELPTAATRGNITIKVGQVNRTKMRAMEFRDKSGQTVSVKMVVIRPLPTLVIIDEHMDFKRCLIVLDWMAAQTTGTLWDPVHCEYKVEDASLERLSQLVQETGPKTITLTPEPQQRCLVVYRPTNAETGNLASAQQLLCTNNLSSDQAISIFLQSAVCVIPDFFKLIATSTPWASMVMIAADSDSWLKSLDLKPVATEYEPAMAYYLALCLLTVAAKGYQSDTYKTSLRSRFETFCTMSGVRKVDISVMKTNIEQVGDGMTQMRPQLSVTTRFLLDTKQTDSVTKALIDQCLMCLSFGGLQGLKIAHEFVQTDRSAVWTLEACVEQAERLDHAWQKLKQLDDFPFARMLGADDADWSHSNYPDVLFCSKLALTNHTKTMEGFNVGNISTVYTHELLAEKLKETLEQTSTGQSSTVSAFLARKGLKVREVMDSQALIEKILSQMKTKSQ